jgi:hypothetical protein
MKDMNENLNLIDKLLLLALDDDKGTFVSNSMVFDYCLAGALLYELTIHERIRVQDDKVILTNPRKLHNEVLDLGISVLEKSTKERKVSYWIDKLAHQEKKLRELVLTKLTQQGILEEKEDKILWVFTQKKYPMINGLPEEGLRKRLHGIVTQNLKASTDEIMIISLVDASSLNKEVYGKELAKQHAKTIKKLIKEYPFADATGKLIKEIHDSIVASVVLLVTTTTIITPSVS